MFPCIIQGNQITLVIDNTVHTVGKTHLAYDKLLEAIKDEDEVQIRELVEPRKAILTYSDGTITIENETFFWDGVEMHNGITTRIVQMLNDGFSIVPMVNFLHNLRQNPSKRSVDLLYGFLDKCTLPITSDGHFLAYKRVNSDYTDCHTGKISNAVGTIVEMPRNEVDDDPNSACSAGLHFCSIDYLQSFGGARTMILKINPKDVVSIPTDANQSKGRCCRYQVVGELNVSPEKAFPTSVADEWQYPTTNYQENDGWITWSGGMRPTDSNVDVRFGNGNEEIDVPANTFSWSNEWEYDQRIIAYRVCK